LLCSLCCFPAPSEDLAGPLIDGDHTVRGSLRTNCHIANVVGTATTNKLVALLAGQRWRCCCCGCCCCAARSLARVNICIVPPTTVRGLQDTPVLVSPESPMRAYGIISTTNATGVVVFHVPLNGQIIPVVAHVSLKHVTTFWTDIAGPLA